VTLNAGFFGYLSDSEGEPIVVDGSQTVEYAGAQWSLLEWYSFDAESDAGASAGLLPGTALISTTLGVRPGEGEPPSCTLELEDASGERTWRTADYDESDFEHRDGTEETCLSDATEPYRLQVHFVVPDDAVEGARLRLFDGDLLPRLLLFPL
jgi:hypothetical protein